jgi:hypothetical protein
MAFFAVLDIMRQERVLWQREVLVLRVEHRLLRCMLMGWAIETRVMPPPLTNSSSEDEDSGSSSDEDFSSVIRQLSLRDFLILTEQM